ncbi:MULTISPECIES: hypothetical protein [Marichromatium]|uniref:Sushi domain-containing protein n=1 Tax=Marichromatium gracile TaxID=1048 RepID=A0A4R4AGG2_MARGR|nr:MULTISPECIES: hypothetical protein [Marichromatium]MBO8086778.1 hypothetical protein [Marichromatium sp.]MBK1708212.1 hypothetical protein [Marichromatium gracile]RNE90731.1 hypothetical protein EBL84_05550 [Marichromatium sp. AB31]RNE92701.1 hypothetical protein EBL85_10900 [Marichromatium sp. AB32]TCW38327.1 hypothetical protein EDC29_102219 [Marichromatium gracile]
MRPTVTALGLSLALLTGLAPTTQAEPRDQFTKPDPREVEVQQHPDPDDLHVARPPLEIRYQCPPGWTTSVGSFEPHQTTVCVPEDVPQRMPCPPGTVFTRSSCSISCQMFN